LKDVSPRDINADVDLSTLLHNRRPHLPTPVDEEHEAAVASTRLPVRTGWRSWDAPIEGATRQTTLTMRAFITQA
jgi:hypothetical protein